MSAPIVFDGVWKRFRRGERHDSLRDLLPALLRAAVRGRGADDAAFWALRDVSFEVKPGRVLGIIGPNGAGKSTILRLLARILHPTRGRVDVQGRVGALIELAAGFHPDLTGRENLYLQGAILGMKRAEIARRFDEIVEFAGVAEFLDTPVKRYSSGMNARLGFAIAAHLEPDVLLVDEVLSVGDLAFQRKATARLREVVRRDVPVVLVSHQLDRIIELCDQAILLAGGTVVREGSARECVSAYIEGEHLEHAAAANPPPVELALLENGGGETVTAGQRLLLRLHGRVTGDPCGAILGVRIAALPREEVVFATNTLWCGVQLEQGGFELEVDLEANLGPGLYRAQSIVWDAADGKEWLRGPSTVFRVERDRPGFGSTFLDPRMRVIPR